MPRDDDPCLCGADAVWTECCGAVLAGRRDTATAEALMRSRYCAFVVGDAEYLLASWASATRPQQLSLEPGIDWRRLRILDTVAGGPEDETGVVEFVAHYREPDGTRAMQRERSRFLREGEARAWRYLDAAELSTG